MRIAVFASHNGSAMRALHDAARGRALSAQICLLVTDNPKASALIWAKENHIPARLISAATRKNATSHAAALLEALQEHKPSIIFLSGYMRKVPPAIIRAYAPHILNIHPALLPRFGGKGMYGRHVHEAVLRAGETKTGATLHIVNDEYDKGAIVAQASVDVLARDTPAILAKRVQSCEHALTVRTFRQIAEGRLNLERIGKESSAP